MSVPTVVLAANVVPAGELAVIADDLVVLTEVAKGVVLASVNGFIVVLAAVEAASVVLDPIMLPALVGLTVVLTGVVLATLASVVVSVGDDVAIVVV